MHGDSGASMGRLFPRAGCWLAQEDGWILSQVWAQVRIPGWNPDCMTIVGSPSVCGYKNSVRSYTCRAVLRVCCAESLSHVWLSMTPWTIAHQAPLSMGFSRQEYWSGLPCPSPGHLPYPGIKPESLMSPALQVDSFPAEPPRKPSWFLLFRNCQPRNLDLSCSVADIVG